MASRRIHHHRHTHRKIFPNRILAAQVLASLLFLGVLIRLFHLQIIGGDAYFEKAVLQQTGTIELPARRGEILTKDKNTGELIKLATNTTLDLVYVDPKVVPDKRLVADTLSPILFTNDDYAICLENPKLCPEGSVEIIQPEITNNPNIYALPTVLLPSRERATEAYADILYRKIIREKVDFLTLKREVSDKTLDKIEKLKIKGVDILREKSLVYIDPTQIPQNKEARNSVAKKVSKILKIPKDEVFKKTKEIDVRYVRLKNKIRPEVSQKIKELKDISKATHGESAKKKASNKVHTEVIPDYFRGVVLVPEHWRYYPDEQVAAQIIGFVNHEGRGQYGIEGKFDRQLSGKNGIIESQNDVLGKGVNPGIIENPEDGIDIVLTIDRVMQKFIEEILQAAVEKFKADSGQIIVLEPQSGKIVALANAPLFNPNSFGSSLQIRRTTPEDREKIFKTTPLLKKDEHERIEPSTFEEFEKEWELEFDPEFYVYQNWLGSGAFINRTVQEVYEPGSVFKPLIMAAALETAEITPNTTFNEDGPKQVGDFTIRTAMGQYHGIQTMTNILETSSNTGMVFVALKLGKSVMHSFIVDKYGFGDYTDIDLDEEEPGKVLPKKDWSKAHLLTASYGQGLTATPLQVVRAWGSLANGGILMQTQIVEEKILPNGTKEAVKPEMLRRVLSPDSTTSITSMLVSAVDNGVAHAAYIPGYKIAGKTGTSQIAGSNGKYETGDGAFITSFAGYAPADNPKYVVYVKFDRPRYGTDRTWGSTTAAPVFKEVMQFLLDYADVPADPDRFE